MRTTLILAGVCAALLFVASPTGAQEARPRNRDLTVVTYEVGDLVVTVPDYVAPEGGSGDASQSRAVGGGLGGGGGGGFGGSRFGVDPRVAGQSSGIGIDPITMPALQRMITKVVYPSSWVDNGGEGQIEAIGASLVVLNSNEAHEILRDLLDRLRVGSSVRRSVSVDARWLLLNSDDLDRLVKSEGEGLPAVDLAVLGEFTRRATSLRGLTNCFSGQSVYLISGTRRNVVRSYIPVVGSMEQPDANIAQAARSKSAAIRFAQLADGGNGFGGDGGGGFGGRGVGYQPIIETPNFGVLLKIRPTLMHGEEAAVVDLTSTVTFPGMDPESKMDAPTPRSTAPMVDRLAIDTQELATTLRVPLGKPMLVGGISYIAPAPGAGDEAARQHPAGDSRQETPQLYLILEVH